MGLWLSRPRVHDKVAVASVISSTITTPGGPGGPGEETAALKRNKGKGTRGGCSVSLFESRIYFRCLSFMAALRYTNEYTKRDVLLSAYGGKKTLHKQMKARTRPPKQHQDSR